jgi:hypothetical protein
MSKFHHYSINNSILIALQKPEATLVADIELGSKVWQACQEGRKSHPNFFSDEIQSKEKQEDL